MQVVTDNLVAAEDFRKNLDKYVTAAGKGNGPIAVLRDAEVVGFFLSPDDFKALHCKAIRKLLKERMQGPTVSQEEAQAYIAKVLRRGSRKS
jgi:hypothetical protein